MNKRGLYEEETKPGFYYPIGCRVAGCQIIGFGDPDSPNARYQMKTESQVMYFGPCLSNLGEVIYPKESLFDKLYLKLKEK